jgi:hypothetical protein
MAKNYSMLAEVAGAEDSTAETMNSD